jgi:superfamily I DNA/RNA helicase
MANPYHAVGGDVDRCTGRANAGRLYVSTFEATFGAERYALANNYRSRAPIVNAFARFSGTMGGGGMSGVWTPTRGAGSAVTVTSAPTLSAEGEAIQNKIEELRKAGVPL